MTMATPERPKTAIREGLMVALVAALLLIVFQVSPGLEDTGAGTHLVTRSRSLPPGDSSYHIRMAWLYRTGEISRAGSDFHWMRETIWNGRFADKDFLYHLFLVPFTLGARDVTDTTPLIWGAKASVVVVGVLLALTLFGVLRGFGVRHAWLYVALTLFFGSYGFLFRLNEVRNWPLSVALALGGWLLMARERRLPLALLALVYTLSYTASHFLLMLWFVRTVGGLIVGADDEKPRLAWLKSDLRSLGAILAGLALGVALHPGHFDLLYTWWVQTVLVPLAVQSPSTFSPLEGTSPGMIFGLEMLPSTGQAIVRTLWPSLAAPLALTLTAARMRVRPSRETVLVGGAALMALALAMSSSRFIEYLGPFMALAVGMFATGIMTSRPWKVRAKAAPRAFKLAPATLVAVLLALTAWQNFEVVRDLSVIRPRISREIGQWLNAAPQTQGKVFFNPRWDQFGDLFFYAPRQDYILGLDPLYLHAHSERKSVLYWDIALGRWQQDPIQTIRDDFKADYIIAYQAQPYALYDYLAEQEKRGRVKLVYASDDQFARIYESVG